MKITFIYPRFKKFLDDIPALAEEQKHFVVGNFTSPPSLGIPILAALTPPDVEIEFIDDNAGDPLDFDAPRDLVAINCFTPQATRAFVIADAFRARGTPVIMGGMFPTHMAEECLQHADSVNIGEGEPTWPQIVEDARRGQLQRIYKGGHKMDLADVPIPRRDLFYGKDAYDWDEDLLQITRGCVYNCAMCILPEHMGRRMRFRPVENVVEELKTLRYQNVYLADDSLFFPQRPIREYATKLFQAVEGLGKRFFVSSTMALNCDREFMQLAARAGVRNFYCTLNVDPVSIRLLQGGEKERQRLVDLVQELEDLDIRFFASFGLGRDWDEPGVADRMLEICDRARIMTSEFFIFTPYPGSSHWDRFERQGRIFDKHWEHYNGAHVVSTPAKMSPEALYDEFIQVWKGFYQLRNDRHLAAMEPSVWEGDEVVLTKRLEKKGVAGQAAITGIGIVSPLGCDVEEVTRRLRAGEGGIRDISRFNADCFRTRFGAEVDGWSPDFLSAKEREIYEDPYLQMGIDAARRALADAGIEVSGDNQPREDIAFVLATCNAGLASAEIEYLWKHGRTDRLFDEAICLQAQFYSFAKAMAAALGLTGECWVVNTACSSSTAALGLAHKLIRHGRCRQVLVGGADALCVSSMSGFDGLKVTSAQPMAPFSEPVGMNLGEGACFWMVEDMELALLANKPCHGKISGHAITGDAHHPTQPDPRGDGVSRTLAAAIADAGLEPRDIGCVNAHGSGTAANDRAECRGIERAFDGTPPPVVSTKSFIGHCMGATGILEATCQLLAMNAGFLHPTLNFTEPRAGCRLDFVPNTAREANYQHFVSANYAFGGNNAAVVISQRDAEAGKREPRTAKLVVTGCGVVSPLGHSARALVDALAAGRSGLGPIERFPVEPGGASWAGMADDFDGKAISRRIDFDRLNRISQYSAAATSQALDQAGLRVTRQNAERVGLAMGVSRGPCEMEHMDSVHSTDNHAADIACFSTITANSTAGAVSCAIGAKGENITLANGPHSGLQALAYACEAIADGRTDHLLAAASEELYAQTIHGYDHVGFLHRGELERDYRLRFDEAKRKVLGEGAACLLVETEETARERGAPVLAEVMGYALGMDAGGFHEANLAPDGLTRAVRRALAQAAIEPVEVDALVWAPQGNAQDRKTLETARAIWGEDHPPLVGTSLQTGFVESASILHSLAAALECATQQRPWWPQQTGDATLDAKAATRAPGRVLLALASTDVGCNYAVVFRAQP